MPPKKKVFHEIIKDTDHFEKIVNAEFGPMAVVDVHLDWCGPCLCMEQNYQTMWFSIDDPEHRISFWQCPESSLPEEWKSKLNLTVEPRFLIFLQGELKKEIKGAKYTDLELGIDQHLPEPADD